MKIDMVRILCIVTVVVGTLGAAGCRKKAGVAERTGAAVDKAAEKSVDAVRTAKEKAGAAVEKAGADMQK